MGHAPQAVCIGEAMALLMPEQAGPMEDVTTLRHSFGGAGADVARGPAALGVPGARLSRVGAGVSVAPDDHGALPPPDRIEELLGCSPATWSATRVTDSGVTSA